MRVSLTSEYRFCATPDGAIWTDGPCHFAHWSRYLAAFERVNVIARVRDVPERPERWLRVDGARVGFSRIPFYSGLAQYVLLRGNVARAVRRAIESHDAVILNSPGRIACCLEAALASGRPYAVQTLGDPNQIFAPGIVRHPLRPLLRHWAVTRLRAQCAGAAATLYVTQSQLQRAYPCPATMFGVSDVDLRPEAFRAPICESGESRSGLRESSADLRPGERETFNIISVGAMSQLYKGFDTLIDALAVLRDLRPRLRLTLVGDGRYRPWLEARAQRAGVADAVEFLGQLPSGAAVREQLDAADLFVLPSRTEGLPRALVEAMARGLPCLASRVGGIPELLDPEDMTPPDNSAALAAAIRGVVTDLPRRRAMAARNFRTAQSYREELLSARRAAFFEYLAERTRAWISASGARDRAIVGLSARGVEGASP